MSQYIFDWGELAFGSKKPINNLHATFIAASREVSVVRFTQLVKTYLPKGNIVLGIAKEDYVLGFEDQPQFKMLRSQEVQSVIDKVNASKTPHKIYTLTYFQRETRYLLDKLDFKKVVLVNGSWKHSFHTRHEYYVLVNRNIDYEMISPFASELEAKTYAANILPAEAIPKGDFTESEMLDLAQSIAHRSFDYSFQTGVSVGRKKGKKYTFLAATFNEVAPHQGYAMHHGASRETHFSPPHDLNHYDTVHAETALIIKAQKQKIDLRGTTLFINLLPCPSCARMFTKTDIEEFVYREDHSSGYAIAILQAAGKKVERIV